MNCVEDRNQPYLGSGWAWRGLLQGGPGGRAALSQPDSFLPPSPPGGQEDFCFLNDMFPLKDDVTN